MKTVYIFGQNLRIFELHFLNSTDFGDTNIVIGRYIFRVSDYAGHKWNHDSNYLGQNVSAITMTNTTTIRITTTFNTNIQAYITSLV